MTRKIIKGLAGLTTAIFIAMAGDETNINDKILYPVLYHNALVDPETYPKPFDLEKKYLINDEGKLEVYMGSGEEWIKVDKYIWDHRYQFAHKVIGKVSSFLINFRSLLGRCPPP